MNSIVKALLASVIISASYGTSAKDDAYTGTVNLTKSTNNTSNSVRYKKEGTAEKSHSGIVFPQKKTNLTFEEKLLSAADK